MQTQPIKSKSGGITSVIAGGDFMDGAAGALIGYLTNHAAHGGGDDTDDILMDKNGKVIALNKNKNNTDRVYRKIEYEVKLVREFVKVNPDGIPNGYSGLTPEQKAYIAHKDDGPFKNNHMHKNYDSDGLNLDQQKQQANFKLSLTSSSGNYKTDSKGNLYLGSYGLPNGYVKMIWSNSTLNPYSSTNYPTFIIP